MKSRFSKFHVISSMVKILMLAALLMNTICLSAQLPLLSNNNVDFTNAVSSISSGNWSDPGIWSNGMVPDASTDVVIENGHIVHVDIQGASTNQQVDLCRHLQVKQEARLQLGHNTPNFAKDLRINGSILCDGTISSGRLNHSSSGTGEIYDFNSRIFLNLVDATTYLSGSGYFHPKALSISSQIPNNQLIIDHYNIVIDDNLAFKSDERVTAVITYHSYVNIKKTLGLTGSVFQFSSPTAKADLTIEGVVLADNASFFTKNQTSGESSSLTIANNGRFFTKRINEGLLNVTSAAAGFELNIQNGGLLKLGENVNFSNLSQGNPNFNLIEDGEVRLHYSTTMTSTSEISSQINANDPNLGVDVSRIIDIFGATHIAGWYNFTSRPYLLEGLDYYRDFGATSVKTSLSSRSNRMYNAYHFNHNWSNHQTLESVAQEVMIDSLFKRDHIKTHTFWTVTRNQRDWREGADFNHDSFLAEEQEFYDLTMYLMNTYGSMDKTFVYQNWEGDWMLRGQGVNWEQNPSLIPDSIDWELEGMARLFRARQRGTERARNQFNNINAKVYHSIEFNKLWWNDRGVRKTMMQSNTPSVLEDVISKVRIDLSSWSAYDGGWSNNNNPEGHAMWKGIEIAKYFTNETSLVPFSTPVQIGEFGINENPPYNGSNTQNVIESRYGKFIGVALGLDIPNFYLWNLYGSGQQGGPPGFTWEKDTQYNTTFLYDWLDGKWIIEPDGSWGHAGSYLMSLWASLLSTEPVNQDLAKIEVFPNPTHEVLNFKNLNDRAELSVYNNQGALVLKQHVYSGETLNIKSLSNGIYYLNILDNSGSISIIPIIKN